MPHLAIVATTAMDCRKVVTSLDAVGWNGKPLLQDPMLWVSLYLLLEDGEMV